MPTPEQIISTARECLGSPYRHCGRSREFGLDCIGLLRHVANKHQLGTHDLRSYSRQPDGTIETELGKILLPQKDLTFRPGQVLIFWIRRRGHPQHAAIATSERTIIHTCSDIGRVVEHVIDARWLERIHRVYAFPGVE